MPWSVDSIPARGPGDEEDVAGPGTTAAIPPVSDPRTRLAEAMLADYRAGLADRRGINASPMSLTPGTYLGPHEILAAIGAGGMGEVCGSVWTPDGRRLAFASDRGRRLAPIGK